MRSPSATTSAWGPSEHQGRGAGGSLSGTMASAGCSGGAGTAGVASGCMSHRNPLILSGLYSRQTPERPVGRPISVSRSVSSSLRALRPVSGHSWGRPGNRADWLRKAVKHKVQADEAFFECGKGHLRRRNGIGRRLGGGPAGRFGHRAAPGLGRGITHPRRTTPDARKCITGCAIRRSAPGARASPRSVVEAGCDQFGVRLERAQRALGRRRRHRHPRRSLLLLTGRFEELLGAGEPRNAAERSSHHDVVHPIDVIQFQKMG